MIWIGISLFFYYSELMVELLRFGHHMNID